MSWLSSIGGRKFTLASFIISSAVIMSIVPNVSPEIRQKWLDMALIVVGFYFGAKVGSEQPGGNHGKNSSNRRS